MPSKLIKLLESNSVKMREVYVPSGFGKLPSYCPNCNAKLDFGPIDGPWLVCRLKCGFTYDKN